MPPFPPPLTGFARSFPAEVAGVTPVRGDDPRLAGLADALRSAVQKKDGARLTALASQQLLAADPATGRPRLTDTELAEVVGTYGGLDALITDLLAVLPAEQQALVDELDRRVGGAEAPPRYQAPYPAALRLALPTDDARQVEAYLAGLAARWPWAHGAPIGRLKGNDLTLTRGPVIALRPAFPPGEGNTINSRLGEGVFVLVPVGRSLVRPEFLLAGGDPYAIELPDIRGNLADTGLRVVADLAVPRPGPTVLYSPRALYFAPLEVTGRAPVDLAKLAVRIEAVLDELGVDHAPATTARLLLQDLRTAGLTPKQTMELLRGLEVQRPDQLGEFLSLVRIPDFRGYLREQEVPWFYVLSRWQPSVNDDALFVAGCLVGAGENVADVVRMLRVLIGAFFSTELAMQRQQLISGLWQFVRHPLVTTVDGFKALLQEFEERMWNLQLFDAGRAAGNVAVTLLTLPSGVKAIGQLAKEVAELTPAAVARVGLSLQTMRTFTTSSLEYVRTEFAQLIRAKAGGTDNVVLVAAGRAQGYLPAEALLSKAEGALAGGRRVGAPRSPEFTGGRNLSRVDAEVEQAIEKAVAELEPPEKAPRPAEPPSSQPPKSQPPTSPLVHGTLDDVVDAAIADLNFELAGQKVSPQVYGSKLHSLVSQRLKEFPTFTGAVVISERFLEEFSGLPPSVLRQTVGDFLKLEANKLIADDVRKSLSRGVLKTKIGRLKPDLLIRLPGGEMILWDLVPSHRLPHQAKTLLYTHLLSKENILSRFAETYYHQPPVAASLLNLAPTVSTGVRGAQKPSGQ